MAGVSIEAGSSSEGVSSGQNKLQCQSSEASSEWRSLEQVENGTPSTSPPYWDIEDDLDGGQKPSELYGRHTWKIDNFSQINRRELRSNVFEVGGYKWYILIYPQGCDVCNHLSLFLCVANHDKLLPGWSHFAQFTIAVVNKDSKKSKYSDTLHRFWKKEHDWGWKKFMELGKVMDEFIDGDALVIKAQVQVIRERADRPFRCLECQYRRELVRVYLTNVEQICRRFVEERRMRLGKLIEDKARWSSFCAFWLGMEHSNRRRMSRERTESILKVVVKQFFVEKEVTSTLVMDSLYSGLKALEGQNKGKKLKGKHADAEALPTPVILIEEDTFVLMDDILLLLERATMEPLPPKDDKGPQNRTKDAAAGEEFNKDFAERDEKRLTELGRRTIEIFVLSHIFSKIEVAYQEAVALKRQEELIREEEAAAWVAIDHKPRRGGQSDKKSKKKGKQKKNNRKGKDKAREEKLNIIAQDKHDMDTPVEIKDLVDDSDMVVEKSEDMEDISDSEALPLDSEERDVSPVNWDTDTSEQHPPTEASSSGISVLSGLQNRPSVVDDSSSTCSSDSVPSVVLNVPHVRSYRNQKNQKILTRRTKNQGKVIYDNWVREEPSQVSEVASVTIDASQSSKSVENPTQADVGLFKDRVNGNDRRVEKEERTHLTNKNSVAKGIDTEASLHGTPHHVASPPRSPSKNIPSINPPKSESKVNVVIDPIIPKKSLSDIHKQADRPSSISNSADKTAASKPYITQKLSTPKPTRQPVSEKTSLPPIPVMSRPLSAPLVPAPRPPISIVQTSPALSRSASAADRLGPEPSVSASSPSYVPQSYRNTIIGSNVAVTSSAYTPNYSRVNASNSYSLTPRPLRMDANPVQPMFSFGMRSRHEPLPSGPRWMDVSQTDHDHTTLLSDMHNLNIYNQVAYSRPEDQLPSDFPPVAMSAHQNHHAVTDEFPHLDIINDLLDDEYVYGNSSGSGLEYPSFNNVRHGLNRQFSFPGDLSLSSGLGPCRFERARSYQDDGFQQIYGASGSPYDMNPQVGPRPYLNGQIEGLMSNQWQFLGSDLPFPGIMNTDNDPYLYQHVPDYSNLPVCANGYSVFRPSNGH